MKETGNGWTLKVVHQFQFWQKNKSLVTGVYHYIMFAFTTGAAFDIR